MISSRSGPRACASAAAASDWQASGFASLGLLELGLGPLGARLDLGLPLGLLDPRLRFASPWSAARSRRCG